MEGRRPSMKFRCDNCNHKLSVPDKHAGKRAKCPKCGQALVIPTPVIQKPTKAQPKRIISLDDPRLLDNSLTEASTVPTWPHNKNRHNTTHDRTPKASPNDLRLLEVPPIDSLEDSVSSQDTGKTVTPGESNIKSSPNDVRLLEVPPADAAEGLDTDRTEEAYEHLRSLQGGRIGQDREPLPQRKLPWILDIFLYPFNKAGMTILLICAGTPFLLRILMKFFFVMMLFVPSVCLILWVLTIIVHWAVLILLISYMNWYIWECIRDSAEGGIRAAETIGTTPGLGDILWQTIRAGLCVLACLAPAIAYWANTRSADQILLALFGLGLFVYPMALLSLVMHDSITALNPYLIFKSILKTFFRYVPVVLFSYASGVLLLVAFAIITSKLYWHLSYILQFLGYCLVLVMAHLLGRFYFKNEEGLYWDA